MPYDWDDDSYPPYDQDYLTASEWAGTRRQFPSVVDNAICDGVEMWIQLRHNGRRGGKNYIGETSEHSIVFVELNEGDPIPDELHRYYVRVEGIKTRGGFKTDKVGRPMYIGRPVRDYIEDRLRWYHWYKEDEDSYVLRHVEVDWTERVTATAPAERAWRSRVAVVRHDDGTTTSVDWVDWRELRARVTIRQECVNTELLPYDDCSGTYYVSNIGPQFTEQTSEVVEITDVTLESHRWPFSDLWPMNQKRETVYSIIWFKCSGQTLMAPTAAAWCDLGKRVWDILGTNYPLCPVCHKGRCYKDQAHCHRCNSA